MSPSVPSWAPVPVVVKRKVDLSTGEILCSLSLLPMS